LLFGDVGESMAFVDWSFDDYRTSALSMPFPAHSKSSGGELRRDERPSVVSNQQSEPVIDCRPKRLRLLK